MINMDLPEIGYVGFPISFKTNKFYVNTKEDFLNLLHRTLFENSKKGIKFTCIDSSEIEFSEEFFSNTLDEESSSVEILINSINKIIIKDSPKIFFYCPKEYFLASQMEEIEIKTKSLLESISFIFDSIGIKYRSIIIRIGSAYGNRRETLKRFVDRVLKLEKEVRDKIVVTNDDKPSLFSVTDLLSGVYYETSIPIAFRFIGHVFNNGGLSIREAIFLSHSTWKGETPILIHSESEERDEDGNFLSSLPSEYLNNRIPTFGISFNVLLEVKKKEEACSKYSREFLSLSPIVFNKKNKKKNDKKI
jgi:UV DNA damage repair endonuclease